MIKSILVANRSDQPPNGGAAAQPNRQRAVGSHGEFTPEAHHD
jgi:hypothetical protein